MNWLNFLYPFKRILAGRCLLHRSIWYLCLHRWLTKQYFEAGVFTHHTHDDPDLSVSNLNHPVWLLKSCRLAQFFYSRNYGCQRCLYSPTWPFEITFSRQTNKITQWTICPFCAANEDTNIHFIFYPPGFKNFFNFPIKLSPSTTVQNKQNPVLLISFLDRTDLVTNWCKN